MNRFSFICAAIVCVLIGCEHEASFCGAGGAPAYSGPTASPLCGDDAYAAACYRWIQDAIPYCYGPAGHGDVGPAPFPACATVSGERVPDVVTDDRGFASWWCCSFHLPSNGGLCEEPSQVTLDAGFAVVIDGGPM